jgi:hypothetical protein
VREQLREERGIVKDDAVGNQSAAFGPDGLLRRHEYTVDILGGAAGVNYAHDYRKVDGISVPMKRRVYPYDADKRKIPDPVFGCD